MIIKDDFCWICWKKFNDETLLDRRTFHHAIEKRYKPKKNFKLSICQKCHYLIHSEDNLYKKRFNMIKGVFDLENKKLEKILNKRGDCKEVKK